MPKKQKRGTTTRTYKQWAEIIASSLSGEQLDAFTEMLDGDADNSFLYALNEINMKRNPRSYVHGE